MAAYTRLTNLQVDGDLKLGSLSSSNKATSADGTAAASSAPTKAEFDKVVTLANELKTKLNALVDKLS